MVQSKIDVGHSAPADLFLDCITWYFHEVDKPVAIQFLRHPEYRTFLYCGQHHLKHDGVLLVHTDWLLPLFPGTYGIKTRRT